MFKKLKSSVSAISNERNNEDVRVNAPKEPNNRNKKFKIFAKYAVRFLIFKLLGWLISQLKGVWDWLWNHVEKILEVIS